jgi:hypothetical protein
MVHLVLTYCIAVSKHVDMFCAPGIASWNKIAMLILLR